MTNHLNEEQLINYVYQLLPDAEREALDLHLSTCPPCRASLADHETLQRRIHYSVAGRRRVAPSSRMNYAAIAPRLKRSRRLTMIVRQSNQFIYGAVTMALLVAVGIGLYFFVSNLSRPTPTTPEEVKQPADVATVVSQPEVKATVEVGQPAVEPGPAGELKWKFKGDNLWSHPVVADGLVYAGNADSNFYALDSQTGQERWKFKTNGPVHGAKPVVAEGVVYFGGRDKYLYALDGQTGQEQWKFNAKSDTPLPTVQDGLVYVGANDLHALDSQTGQELWQFKTIGMTRNAPLVVDGVVFIGSGLGGSESSRGSEENEGYFYAVDAQTGQEKWQTKVVGLMRWPVPMSIAEGLVIAGNHEYLYALERDTGQVKWQLEVATPLPIVAGGLIYFSSSDGHLYALEAQSGQEQWKFKTSGPIHTVPIFADGVVYIGSEDHYLYAVDAQTGQEQWKFETEDWADFATFADGVVYFGSGQRDGHLYAVWAAAK